MSLDQFTKNNFINGELIDLNFLLLLFVNKKAHYCYDVVSGRIFKVSKLIYKLLEIFKKKTNKERMASILKLRNSFPDKDINEGLNLLFKKSKELIKTVPTKITTEIYEKGKLNNSNFSIIVLEVTRDCNFRCSYCISSGNYKYEARYSNDSMSLNTAYKSLDYLYACGSKSNPNPTLIFYGGEPLLKKEFVKKCIEYGENKFNQINFSIQTNGYDLDHKFSQYIIDHNVFLSVSLDGPKSIQDRCRVLSSGKGTYDKIISNLEFLNKLDNQFFNEKVGINYTIHPSDLEDVILFHKNHPFLKNCSPMLNFISGFSLINSISLEQISKTPDKINKNYLKPAIIRYLNGIINNNLSNLQFEDMIFSRSLERIAKRSDFERKSSQIDIGDFCQIGKLKLFIKCDGDISFCEKTARLPIIGNINSGGINWGKVNEIEKKCHKLIQKCANCWALFLCDICWIEICGDKNIDKKIKNSFCKEIKKRIKYYLNIYTRIHESDKNGIRNLHNFFKD